MVKVVEGGQCSATRARFSPGVRTGLHLVAAEATDTPRPITIETAKTSKSLFKFPLLTSLSPCSSVCPMSDAYASTPRLNSCTRIAHSPGPINHQLPCCGARLSGIMSKAEEDTIIPFKAANHSQGRSRLLDRGYANFVELRFGEVRLRVLSVSYVWRAVNPRYST